MIDEFKFFPITDSAAVTIQMIRWTTEVMARLAPQRNRIVLVVDQAESLPFAGSDFSIRRGFSASSPVGTQEKTSWE